MKKYFKFVAIFVLMIASATSWANYAILYKDTNFNINAGSLFASSYDNSYRVVGVDNDSFSSVIVSTGTCLVVFKDSDYRGDHIFFSEGEYSSLGAYNFNDTISSLWVYPIQGLSRTNSCNSSDLVYFYRDSNFGGSHLAAPADTSDGIHRLNDEITSIKVPSGLCAVLTKHANFGGTKVEFDDDVSTLSDYDFNDEASTFMVTSAGLCDPTAPSDSSSGGSGGNMLNQF
ncbi:beta/gamma crystallin-related protein [Alteromonas stellipolaris]|uniref:beta/gamma crystallin-related protein n=1 Tax=Alteromonas stellipolaris TaxID=233316 RepID=UPI002494014B|nr:beta/gamma crystallin-related protein [Alteromonas stellipolaris]